MITPMFTPPPVTKKPKAKTPEPAREENPVTNSRRVWSAKKRQSPRHQNSVRRVLRIAQAAWEGRSAGEIADEIGVGTQYVYQLCTDYRIKLAPKTKSQYAMRVILQLKTIARLERLAAERGESVDDMTARMIDALSREPVLLSNLIDDDDNEALPKKKRTPQPRKKIEDRIYADDGREDED